MPLTRLAALASAVFALAVPAAASAADAPCTKTWDGPATGNWSVAANWAPDGVPGAADGACIGTGTSTTVNAAISVRAVHSERALHVSEGNLTLADAAETSRVSAMLLQNYDVYGDGDLEVDTLTWHHGGEFFGSGTVEILTSMTAVNGYLGVRGQRTVILNGTSDIGSAYFWTNGGARLVNRGALTTAGNEWGGDTVDGVAPVFHNAPGATVTKTGPFNLGFYSGTLALDNDGTIAMGPGATGRIYIDRSPAGAQSNGVFTGNGVFFTGGEHTLGPDAVLTQVHVGSTVRYPHEAPLAVTDIIMVGGRLAASGQVTLNGTATDLGYGTVSAPLVVHPAGATASWRAAFEFDARRVETAGTITITGTGAGGPVNWPPRMVWENTGTLNLQAGSGHFRLASTADEASRLINRGTIVKSTTLNTFTFDPVLVNDGVIDVRFGQLVSRRFEQTPDGTLRFDIHGTAQGSGYGFLSTTALRYSGRLEATLSGGHVPPAGQRYNVLLSTVANRSGLFHSSALSGLTLDETQAANIAVVQPAAAAVRSASSSTAAPDSTVTSSAHPAQVLAASPALMGATAFPAPRVMPQRSVRKAKARTKKRRQRVSRARRHRARAEMARGGSKPRARTDSG